MIGEQRHQFDSDRAAEERKMIKTRLDQCLGCHWGDPANVQPVSATTLAGCSGHPDPKQRLGILRRRGIVETQAAEEAGVTRNLHKPTNTEAARDYVAELPKGPCRQPNTSPLRAKMFEVIEARAPGTTTPEQLAAANADAEQFVLRTTDANKKLITRRHMLGCLACHLLDETSGRVTTADVSACTGRSITAARNLLDTLQAAEILELADTSKGSRRRHSYKLAETDRGREFAALLTPPDICDFQAGQQQAEQPPASSLVIAQPQEMPGLYNNGEQHA